jgi:hypothetical protein
LERWNGGTLERRNDQPSAAKARRGSCGRHAKQDITLRIYAHLFRKDDGKAAAAINAALMPRAF